VAGGRPGGGFSPAGVFDVLPGSEFLDGLPLGGGLRLAVVGAFDELDLLAGTAQRELRYYQLSNCRRQTFCMASLPPEQRAALAAITAPPVSPAPG
jgi:hypothetical protein